MIGISFNKKEFEYDAYTLVKAFYPKEEIEMYYTEEIQEEKSYDRLISILYDCALMEKRWRENRHLTKKKTEKSEKIN